jgi:hypothetical protein
MTEITAEAPTIAPLLSKDALDKANGAPMAEKSTPKKDEAEGGLAPPPTKGEARNFAAEFMVGELLKSVKKHFVPQTKPFTHLSEFQQTSLLTRVADDIRLAVKEAVEVIASDARLTFRAQVDSVTFKDGVKATLKLAKTEHAHHLADQAGSAVLIVVEDFARYINAGDEARGEPDQPPLFDASKREEKDEADKLAPKRAPKKKVQGRAPARKGRGK